MLAGEHTEQLRPQVAAEALGFHAGEDGRDVEDLRALGQGHGVVLQLLAVDGLHAEGHLRVVVDQDQGGVGRVQQFADGHGISPGAVGSGFFLAGCLVPTWDEVCARPLRETISYI
ncbi:hypothetical protein D3C86_1946050 [compost metagenome]